MAHLNPILCVILNLVLNLFQYWFRISQDETLKQVQGDRIGEIQSLIWTSVSSFLLV
jgi:hypothetical protein